MRSASINVIFSLSVIVSADLDVFFCRSKSAAGFCISAGRLYLRLVFAAPPLTSP